MSPSVHTWVLPPPCNRWSITLSALSHDAQQKPEHCVSRKWLHPLEDNATPFHYFPHCRSHLFHHCLCYSPAYTCVCNSVASLPLRLYLLPVDYFFLLSFLMLTHFALKMLWCLFCLGCCGDGWSSLRLLHNFNDTQTHTHVYTFFFSLSLSHKERNIYSDMLE